MDVRAHNRSAWDQFVDDNNRWTVPVSADDIARATNGDWQVILTPTKSVPRSWFPKLQDLSVLCLACGGGQQGPILAAAGARVTVFDNSPRQLDQDRLVARRNRLNIEVVEGDMADLSAFNDSTFGLIFHPCSNCFVPDVRPVWRECHRVLRDGGILLTGFTNPIRYAISEETNENGKLELRYSIPYSDLANLDKKERREWIDSNQPVEFGHTLDDQLGGQIDAGFAITGFYEDGYSKDSEDWISKYMSTFVATRAEKG